jgi:5'-nucleotidase
VTVGIIAFNDFHGALEPPKQSVFLPGHSAPTPTDPQSVVGVPAGGAAWLASAIDSLRAKYPNNAVVSAGDMISASQISSSLYLDEPTIGVMNRIGVDFNAVGNHEFDRGREELLRLVWGYEHVPLTRTVDIAIARLRRKIEPDPHHPRYLRTAHRDGYSLMLG